MQAFLYLNLALPANLVSYQQPVLQLVKASFPDVATLDIDGNSDEMLVHYANRMLQEASQVVVCIKAEEGAPIQTLMALLESLPQAGNQQLILLAGTNKRIQRILEARPQLNFKLVHSDAELLAEVKAFYS